MKEVYSTPAIEVVVLSCEDIVATSAPVVKRDENELPIVIDDLT